MTKLPSNSLAPVLLQPSQGWECCPWETCLARPRRSGAGGRWCQCHMLHRHKGCSVPGGCGDGSGSCSGFGHLEQGWRRGEEGEFQPSRPSALRIPKVLCWQWAVCGCVLGPGCSGLRGLILPCQAHCRAVRLRGCVWSWRSRLSAQTTIPTVGAVSRAACGWHGSASSSYLMFSFSLFREGWLLTARNLTVVQRKGEAGRI